MRLECPDCIFKTFCKSHNQCLCASIGAAALKIRGPDDFEPFNVAELAEINLLEAAMRAIQQPLAPPLAEPPNGEGMIDEAKAEDEDMEEEEEEKEEKEAEALCGTKRAHDAESESSSTSVSPMKKPRFGGQ